MNLSFYHNAGKIYLSVLFILTNSFLIQAQNISNNLWSDLSLNYEIFNTIDLKYEIGNRSNDNGARKSYHDFIIKYSVVYDELHPGLQKRRSWWPGQSQKMPAGMLAAPPAVLLQRRGNASAVSHSSPVRQHRSPASPG